jgi:hypothetical protein
MAGSGSHLINHYCAVVPPSTTLVISVTLFTIFYESAD